MFGLFKPKEIRQFFAGLDRLEGRIGSTSSFSQVRAMIVADSKRDPESYVAAIRNSKAPEQVAATSVANVSGDIVESGRLHLYRGVLSPAGEAMLKLYKDATAYLVSEGVLDEAQRTEEVSFILRNIKNVG